MKAIVAMTPERVIGHHGRIPWHIPEDFRWFKKKTMGHSLIMGRSTFDSLGKPLPGRFTYILTTDAAKLALPKADGCMYVSYDSLMQHMVSNTWAACETWVCGGAKVYKTFLPVCDEVFATIVLEDYEGDTYMPEFEHMFLESEILLEAKTHWIVRYFNPDWSYKPNDRRDLPQV